MTRPEENLHLWKMLAEENDCFERPYPFANDQARFLFLPRRTLQPALHAAGELRLQGDADGRSSPARAKIPGWPRTGPNCRLCRSIICEKTSISILRTIRARSSQLAREKCREHLRARLDFVFNATNTMRLTRKRWIDLFSPIIVPESDVIYLERPLAVLLAQNERRTKIVPTRVIERLIQKLEPPTRGEAHAVAFVE